MITIPYLQDPGHGWFKVPVALLRELGIANKISAYSYVSKDGTTAYLEEDCDAMKFFEAMKRLSLTYWIDDGHHCKGDSFIRRLPSWASVAPLFAADAMPPIPPRAGETLNLFGD